MKKQPTIEQRQAATEQAELLLAQTAASTREAYRNAAEMKELLQKTKGIIWSKQAMRPFKEPILLFINRQRELQFYEGGDLNKGRFRYKTAENYTVEYWFDPSDIITFEYAGQKTKGYIQYELSCQPYPHKPIDEALHIQNGIEKVETDLSKWKLQQEQEATKKLMIIVWIALIAVGGYVIYNWLVAPQLAARAAATVAQNITNITGIAPV